MTRLPNRPRESDRGRLCVYTIQSAISETAFPCQCSLPGGRGCLVHPVGCSRYVYGVVPCSMVFWEAACIEAPGAADITCRARGSRGREEQWRSGGM